MDSSKKQDIQMGERLREIRENLGYTREEYAELFHISPDQYERLERGESRITVDKVQILYETFFANSQKAQRDTKPDLLSAL